MTRPGTPLLRHVGVAAEVTGSQLALAASGYLVLVMAARALPPAGFAALSSFYLLVNTVGRGTFAAVELELTRAVAQTRATGTGERALLAAAVRRTLALAVLALLLVAACAPLLASIVEADVPIIALLGAGAVAMAASYHLRGLLAGRRSYHSYAASYWVEAVLVAGLATGLLLAGVTSLVAWATVFVVPALVAAGLVAFAGRVEVLIAEQADQATVAEVDETPIASTRRELGWSAMLLLASQAVWNLAPVIVTVRLTDEHTAAASFVAVAIVLRAPVLVFPALQALLLPRLTARLSQRSAALDRVLARFRVVLGVAVIVWLVAAVTVVPPLTQLVFGVPTTPGTVVLLLLALSTSIAATAQVTQTKLLAARLQHAVGLTWLAGLVVLLLLVAVPIDPELAGGIAQCAAAIVVAGALTVLWNRRRRQLPTAAQGDTL